MALQSDNNTSSLYARCWLGQGVGVGYTDEHDMTPPSETHSFWDFFVFYGHTSWDFSSPTRDRTQALGSESEDP